MRILFLTIGDEKFASSRTRVFQYLPHLEKKGIEFKVYKYETGNLAWVVSNFSAKNLLGKILYFLVFKINSIIDMIYKKINLYRFIKDINNYDVVFIQKVLLPLKYHKRINKKPLIFDFDDALYADDFYQKSLFDEMLKISSLIILENDETAAYVNQYNNNNILKITGPIDCDRYTPSKRKVENDQFCIGWVGSSSTTKFLNIIEEPLRRLNLKYPGKIIFKSIGATNYTPKDIETICVKWTLATETIELENFDIGVMPLYDNEFTRGKGGYKLLQYMALGIPSIASPVGINNEIIEDNINGFKANSDEEWFKYFELLYLDNKLRNSLGTNAREIAFEKYSFNHYTDLMINNISKIIENA